MTDKEIALELTKAYLEHKNTQIEAKHSHTDVEPDFIQNAYQHFYDTVKNVDGK